MMARRCDTLYLLAVRQRATRNVIFARACGVMEKGKDTIGEINNVICMSVRVERQSCAAPESEDGEGG